MNHSLGEKLSGRDYGFLARQHFLRMIKQVWGEYESLNLFLYKFSNGKKALTLFSSLNSNNIWWYGVSELIGLIGMKKQQWSF